GSGEAYSLANLGPEARFVRPRRGTDARARPPIGAWRGDEGVARGVHGALRRGALRGPGSAPKRALRGLYGRYEGARGAATRGAARAPGALQRAPGALRGGRSRSQDGAGDRRAGVDARGQARDGARGG